MDMSFAPSNIQCCAESLQRADMLLCSASVRPSACAHCVSLKSSAQANHGGGEGPEGIQGDDVLMGWRFCPLLGLPITFLSFAEGGFQSLGVWAFPSESKQHFLLRRRLACSRLRLVENPKHKASLPRLDF